MTYDLAKCRELFAEFQTANDEEDKQIKLVSSYAGSAGPDPTVLRTMQEAMFALHQKKMALYSRLQAFKFVP